MRQTASLPAPAGPPDFTVSGPVILKPYALNENAWKIVAPVPLQVADELLVLLPHLLHELLEPLRRLFR